VLILPLDARAIFGYLPCHSNGGNGW